ncbi:ubiquinone/menaquinone biosynthesis C-methylase UbiE [Olsenella profusa DSM 13989]|uniref:Methyltransferase domain protein n=1 Tax=Olsenella profusa F0195 TaxID=1125712 RepID=U2UXU1_9ACTN|nr:class I SAM-dependent methyltransferase [Olsenella profusa]ERL07917.1 methyltransferase domain protein [Olsenella profusa F0195]MDP9859793.1 ubiquinone/menaquinone biosynthesis C-methylase UbiE [Olsenella profusa DSM 13989]
MSDRLTERQITDAGNPAKPTGVYGARMLHRMNRSHADVTNWALDFIDFSNVAHALDIGCGGGATMARLLARMGGRDGTVCGVDHSEISCEESRALNAEAIAAGRAEVLQADVESLPFADGSFDVAVTVESFYFWPRPQEDLVEVARVLAPGAHFLLVADVYQKDGLPAETLENIRKRNLTVLAPDEYEASLTRAGLSSVTVHLRDGTTWIAVEGVR